MRRFAIDNSKVTQCWAACLVDALAGRGQRVSVVFRDWSNDLGFEHGTLAAVLSVKELPASVPVVFQLDRNDEVARLKAVLFLAASFEYSMDLRVDDELFLSLTDTVMVLHKNLEDDDGLLLIAKSYGWHAI